MKMIMRAKINTGAIAMGIVGVILAGAVAGIGASNTKQPSAPSTAPRLKQEHPAGCYLIWGNRDLVRTCDFLKGGQIMVQWRDIAPARGKFDWSKLDEGLRFFAKIGRPTTVQVNANDEKPDWLWDYVANCGNNRGVIPQYWDPRYIAIQKELITALADHLKASPYRHLILCVRASPNAIGTEHMWVLPADRSPSDTWIYPPDGHRCPTPWTRGETSKKYYYTIMKAYMDALMPEINVALRANLFTQSYPDGDAQHLIDEGGWIFGTGSDIDPHGTNYKSYEDVDLFSVQMARSGKTKAYWENWGTVESHPNGISWNYWRCLMELHKGVSYVAVKGWAVRASQKNPEFVAAFEFVNRYAGFHTAPAESPGAWCALRGGKERPRGNYWWFLEQIDPDGTSVAVESNHGRKMIGPDEQRFGRFARRTDVASGKREFFFRLDPKFRASLRRQPCRLRVWYLDNGQGAWRVRWGSGQTGQRTVRKTGSGRWKEYLVDLPRSAFHGMLERRSDLALVATGEDDTTFHMVEIEADNLRESQENVGVLKDQTTVGLQSEEAHSLARASVAGTATVNYAGYEQRKQMVVSLSASEPIHKGPARQESLKPIKVKNRRPEFNIAYHLCSDPHAGLELNVTEREMDEDFERIKAIGFTHVTLWAGSVLNEDIGNVKLMKLAVRKAAQHGLGCYIWFWTAGKPLMYGQPGWDAPPIVDKNGERVKYMNIWDETWRSGFLQEYLNWLGRTFRVFPNVAGYVVDEPFGSWWKWEEYGYDVRTKQQFILWLQRKYGDIKKLNQTWNTDYKTWAQIAPPHQGTMKTPNWRDWTEARQQFSVDWVADINRCLKKAHPGCRIVWSITRRYVDNTRADELADCLDWQRIVPQFDAILMAKFPTRKGQDQFVPFTQEVLSGLRRKPEAAHVGKIYAIVLWESGWVSKIEPGILNEILDLVASHDYDLYVWAWQGVDHLEAWGDLQAVFAEFIQKAKQIRRLGNI